MGALSFRETWAGSSRHFAEWLVWLVAALECLPFKTLDLPWCLSLTECLLFLPLSSSSIEFPPCGKIPYSQGRGDILTPNAPALIFISLTKGLWQRLSGAGNGDMSDT